MAKSAIGEYGYYVHAYAANYLAKDGGNSISGAALIQQARKSISLQKNKLKSGISKKSKQEYANALASFHMNANTTNATQTEQQIKNTVEAYMNNTSSNIASKTASIDWTRGQVFSDINSVTNSLTNNQKSKTQNKQYLSIDKYNLDLQQALAKFKTLSNSTIISGNTVSNWIKDTNDAIKKLQMYNNKNEVELEKDDQLKKVRRQFGRHKKTDYLVRVDDKNNFDFLQKLNNIIAASNFNTGLLRTETGKLEEAIAYSVACGLVGNVASSLAEVPINVAKHSPVGGMTGSSGQLQHFDVSGLTRAAQEASSSLKGLKNKLASTGTKVNFYSNQTNAQEKVDIIVPMKTGNLIEPIKKVAVSVKNTNLSNVTHGTKLVGDTNLWRILNNEHRGSFNYLKHYLNIMAEHNLTLDTGKNKLKELRNGAITSAKILSFYKGISGDVFGGTAAQLFVVYDNNGKKAYVAEIADIVDWIMDTVKTGKSGIETFINFKDSHFTNLLKNDWVEGEKEQAIAKRMAGIIDSLHKAKVVAAFQPLQLKSILSKIPEVASSS